jgi:hypothetical protein
VRRVVAVVVGGLLLSVAGCTKTVYVTTTDAPTAPTSTIIPTTTMVSFSKDLRVAAAACLDSMPELRRWDSAISVSSSGLERNVEECRGFRILALAEKTDSIVLKPLISDLDEYLSTAEYIISWTDQCDKAARLEDPEGSLEYSNCRLMGIAAEAYSSDNRSRASRITQNLQELLSQ